MPVPATVRVRQQPSGASAASGRTDTLGRYALALQPGTYTVLAVPDDSSVTCKTVNVTVGESGYSEANISCR
jgi:hypothetical protein